MYPQQQSAGVRALLFFSGLFCVVSASGCVASNPVVRRVTSRPNTTVPYDRVVYALPRTQVVVSFRLSRISYDRSTPPPCATEIAADEREQFGLPNEVPPVNLFVATEPTLSTNAIPDPTQVFEVELNSSRRASRSLSLALSERGFLTRSESTETSSGLDIYASVARTTAAIVTAGVGVLSTRCTAAKTELSSLLEFDRSWARAPIAGDPRYAVLDASAIRDALVRAQARRTELMALFDGERTQVDAEVRCVVDPSDTAESTTTISLVGVAPTSDLQLRRLSTCFVSGQLSTNFSAGDIDANWPAVVLKVERAPAPVASVARPAEGSAEHSFAYRVPGHAELGLSCRGQTRGQGCRLRAPTTGTLTSGSLVRKDAVIAQFGTIAMLPIVHRLHVEQTVELDPETGALRAISLSSAGVTTEQVEGIGNAAESLVGLPASLDQARVDALQREHDRLELQEQIRTLESAE